MERLGYGTHLTVAAIHTQQTDALDENALLSLLAHLAASIELGCDVEFLEVAIASETGPSAARLCSESQFFIHLFPTEDSFSFRVFTRRNAGLSRVVEVLRERFGTGRFESHISSVSKLVEHDAEAVKAMLLGDRSYARARFIAVGSGS